LCQVIPQAGNPSGGYGRKPPKSVLKRRPVPELVEGLTHYERLLGVIEGSDLNDVALVNGDDQFAFKPGIVAVVFVLGHVAPRYPELAGKPLRLHPFRAGLLEDGLQGALFGLRTKKRTVLNITFNVGEKELTIPYDPTGDISAPTHVKRIKRWSLLPASNPIFFERIGVKIHRLPIHNNDIRFLCRHFCSAFRSDIK